MSSEKKVKIPRFGMAGVTGMILRETVEDTPR
jgi:hypothetical protein